MKDEIKNKLEQFISTPPDQDSEAMAVSDLEGNLFFVNKAFATMHGYTSDELMGAHLSIFHSQEQIPSVVRALWQLREIGNFSGEVWHMHRDGTAFPCLMKNSLVRDEKGKLIGMMMGTLH